jgi:predicted O-methyltransferase YrrM
MKQNQLIVGGLIGAGAVVAVGAAFELYRRLKFSSQAKSASGGTLVSHPGTYRYLLEFIGETASERALRVALESEPRAIMMGSPDEAYFLKFMLEAMGAKRVVEVGVFRGTTTLQLALGVGPGGEVHALDVDDAWLDAGGRRAWLEAGVSDRIKFVKGPAVASMKALLGSHRGAIDFVFVDANKSDYLEYYELGIELLRTGGVIAVDNVLWHGKAQDPPAGDADSLVISSLNQRIRADPRVKAVMLGIADGVYLARKL